MQAAMSMNTIALGGIARPTARVAAKKSVFGMPVPGKSTSGFSVRRTVAPATVAMAVESKADPIMEPPFKGITDDIKARAPSSLTTSSRASPPSPWCATRSFSLGFSSGSLANFPRDQRTTRLARGSKRIGIRHFALEFDIRSFARLATTRVTRRAPGR